MIDLTEEYNIIKETVTEKRPDLLGIINTYLHKDKNAALMYLMCFEIADYAGYRVPFSVEFSAKHLMDHINSEIKGDGSC